MNTLPIQIAAPANAAADAASKGRASNSPDAESPFRQVLKDEVAERRQAQAESSPQTSKSEQSAPSAQTRPPADADEEKEKAEPALTETLPEDMTQYLVLTSQFIQPVSNQQAASPKEAATAASATSVTSATFAAPVDAVLDGGEADGGDASAAVLPLSKPLIEEEMVAAEASALARQAAEPALEIQQSQQPPMPAVSSAALQQAGVERLQGHSDPTADRIAPRVASPAWNQAIGQKVVWMVGKEQQSASLTLNPPDLGPLQVVIKVSENTATANFVSAHPEVRQALEAAMPRLREMLGEAGVQLGQTHVGAGTSGEYGAWEQQQFAQPAPNGEAVFSALPDAMQPAQVIRRGLVDTFV